MGEYATYKGKSVKIGTCENLYYLRADQAELVRPTRGSLDPRGVEEQRVIRFRFPWPDEDRVEPGAFEPYDRAVEVPGYSGPFPEGLDHHSVQFVADAGYNVCLPCPEGPSTGSHGLLVHRNGFAGRVLVCQQGYRDGVLAVICRCGGCGARYNIPTLVDAQPLIDACRAEAIYMEPRNGWWLTVADRVEAGYGATIHARGLQGASPS